jgi:DNA-binding transcriptional ArsR family regulator
MPESDETYKRLARMEQDLADLQSMTRTLLRTQGSSRADDIIKALESDDALRQVYALVDGVRSTSEIVDAIKGKASPRTVARKLDDLEHEWELITFFARRNPGGTVYRKSLTAEVLKIDRRIR